MWSLELVKLSSDAESVKLESPQLELAVAAVRLAEGSSSAVRVEMLELVTVSSGAESSESEFPQLELRIPAVELQRSAVSSSSAVEGKTLTLMVFSSVIVSFGILWAHVIKVKPAPSSTSMVYGLSLCKLLWQQSSWPAIINAWHKSTKSKMQQKHN